MKQYEVLHSFIDVVEDRGCKKGSAFIAGDLTDEARLQSLLSEDNHQGVAMIKEVETFEEFAEVMAVRKVSIYEEIERQKKIKSKRGE